ncbi:MAG: alpha/beta fold hydrolase [Mangrovicoccus sp.]
MSNDGVKLRAGVLGTGPLGTVFIFTGRTEYLEKYGPVGAYLSAAGWSVACIDWRGQGLSDRLLPDPALGHVGGFPDYQTDVAALVEFAERENLPKPWTILAHSMGGCIALRALLNGFPAEAALFTGPMWGINISPALRPLARILPSLAVKFGMGHWLVPSTKRETYVLVADPEDNLLTSCAKTYRWLQSQLRSHPELGIGGPTLEWLRQAIIETDDLAAIGELSIPTLTFLGSKEQIVNAARITDFTSRWSIGQLQMVEGGHHEVLMERAHIRDKVLDDSLAFLAEAIPARSA